MFRRYIYFFTLKTVNRKNKTRKKENNIIARRKNTKIFDVDTHKTITKIARLDNTKSELFQNMFSVLPKLPILIIFM